MIKITFYKCGLKKQAKILKAFRCFLIKNGAYQEWLNELDHSQDIKINLLKCSDIINGSFLWSATKNFELWITLNSKWRNECAINKF